MVLMGDWGGWGGGNGNRDCLGVGEEFVEKGQELVKFYGVMISRAAKVNYLSLFSKLL